MYINNDKKHNYFFINSRMERGQTGIEFKDPKKGSFNTVYYNSRHISYVHRIPLIHRASFARPESRKSKGSICNYAPSETARAVFAERTRARNHSSRVFVIYDSYNCILLTRDATAIFHYRCNLCVSS